MRSHAKTTQLQIRVSPKEKARIAIYAKKANMSVSQWVLNKALPQNQRTFQKLLEKLSKGVDTKYVFAEIHDLLTSLSREEFETTVNHSPPTSLSDFHLNYIAAMVEYAARKKGQNPPSWTARIESLKKPYFGTDLKSLRLHLLVNSPPPFRRRNIFIDSSIGDRV